MSYIIEKIVKSPEEIKLELPISEELKIQVEKDRKEICNILEGKDKRILLILGPCSAWPKDAVIEYAKQIKEIEKLVSDKIKIILRTYTQKPRTALGWTGPANQPDPFAISDIEKGIVYCRKMMLEILKLELPIADEALFTHKEGYFDDLLSWIAIGARSSEDQEHRIYASMINHPVGIKNPTSSNIKVAINSILAAQHTHVFLLNQKQIRTLGNPHSHLVLRGGNSKSNLNLETFNESKELMEKMQIENPSIIADCSHENSINLKTGKKDPTLQPKTLIETYNLIKDKPELNSILKGFMIESFIKTGNQDLKTAKNINELDMKGLSITDGCIGIEETKKLIEDFYELIIK